MTCIVKSCKNVKRLLPVDSNISFHNFPKDVTKFNSWLNALDIYDENTLWKRTMLICSEHFNPNDFMQGRKYHVLKSDAVPCISRDIEIIQIQDTTPTPSTSQAKVSSEAINESQPPTLSPITEPRSSDFEFPSPEHSPKKFRKRKKSSSGSTSELHAKKRKYRFQSSGSSDSSIDRKKKLYKVEHNYSRSPGRVQHQATQLKIQCSKEKKKVYRARECMKKLKRKINNLKEVVRDLKNNDKLSSYASEHLETTFGAIPNAVFARMKKSAHLCSSDRSKYPEVLRKFAVTLHFYSARAYDYVRKTFNLSLPHPSTIRKWSSVVECNPGFSTVCFDALKVKVDEAKKNNRKVICSLLLDEMSIKKQIDFDGHRNWGFVNVGTEMESYEIEPASEALVIMVVAHNASWKLPIAYFLIKSLTGAEKANIVNEALIRLAEAEVEITSVTCDGPSPHFTMFRELGCNFTNLLEDKIITFFKHPSDPNKKVYAILDICHMLKLTRNCLGDLEVFIDSEGNEIKWSYIKNLHNLQEEETLKAANKLGKKHMLWKKQKMKVNLAAQTLSNSVAVALTFLCDDLKMPEFQGCQATVNFLKIIDSLFDLMNSRLPWMKNFKGPLRMEGEENWRPFIINGIKYLLKLKDIKGTPLWQTPRKTPFIGFVISLTSVLGIFDDYVKTNHLTYLLTYKLSQDHLELFFCAIRSRNGWNNNPSALQFMRTYRKLILHADVSSSGGNCQVLDSTSVLTVSSGNKKIPEFVDFSNLRKNNISYESVMLDHDYDIHPKYISLNDFADNVVTYMGGYVIKMLKRTVYCENCIDLVIQEPNYDEKRFSLMHRKNWGSYFFPSKGVIKICIETELFIRKLMYITKDSLPSPDLMGDIINYVSSKLIDKLEIIFPCHREHSYNLLKLVIKCYSKIRINSLAKKYTIKIQGDLIRQKFNKLILFKHQ